MNVPLEHPDAARWVAAEASANHGFVEAHYDEHGIRREPRLKVMWPETNADYKGLGPDDVLLVTGGGKGIAAESALQLARHTGCRLALLGRSDPASDSELKSNLDRIARAGVSFSYFITDITDAAAVKMSLLRIASELGPITAVLHGAGTNDPRRLEEITVADLNQTLAPKLTGLHNILDNIDAARLRLLLTFGSIIARTGLHGEAHYGLANEWLRMMVERWREKHAHCRCLNLEWSVWAGVGMGQRLGVLDSLVRQGITPLPVDDAIEHLKSMLAWKQAPLSSIVTGRFGSLPTLKFDPPELPLLRFLEHPRLHHPGIELIIDAELSADTDPYVTEHAFQGEQLFPAVMGMEAMAQAAMALEQSQLLPCFRELRFEHPIVIPRTGRVTIRVAVLRRRPETVSAAVRCSSTGFQMDHFCGECIFDKNQSAPDRSAATASTPGGTRLDPSHTLYERILFHRGRFCRVESYDLLHSDKSIARLGAPAEAPWFGRHLPPELVMGDAASRDAALHSIQACIPHKTILPVGIDRITPGTGWTRAAARVHATERIADGDNFVYDLCIEDADGRPCEEWEGLHLRAVAAIEATAPWPLGLLVPYLERKVRQVLAPCGIKIGFAVAGAEQCECAIGNLVHEVFGAAATLIHRPDGKPEIVGASSPHSRVSLSHSGDITLLFSADYAAGCDLEKIVYRDPEGWEQLLGAEEFALAQLLAGVSKAPFDHAAAQLWTLKEGLRKGRLRFHAAHLSEFLVARRLGQFFSRRIQGLYLLHSNRGRKVCLRLWLRHQQHAMTAYEYRHVVGFEETNLVGNVYYVSHLRWQGRAREMFLREYVPEILGELERGLALITLHCSCQYLGELRAFDQVIVRMFLDSIAQNRIAMRFEYWREGERPELVGRGEQEIACMRRQGEHLVPAPIPAKLQDALAAFAEPQLR